MPDLWSVCLTLFVVGLLGGGHCVGMCGGIVGALSVGGPAGKASLPLHLAYNAGRIASYTLAGALAGLLSRGGFLLLQEQWAARVGLFVLANLMLLAMGLYLMGITRFLTPLEQAGQGLWQRLQPLTRRFLPVRSPMQAFPLGLLWGWLPCGLVYSALATALTTGSASNGALVMLAFGLGTLPNLLLAGLLAARLREWMRRPGVRRVAGALIISFGLYGLWGALQLGHNIRL